MALTPGTRLGPYEIITPLGAGGMGEVYRASDTRLDRIVAIKILPDALASDPQFRQRFDREARTISQFDHPHICAVYDVGEHNRTAYLVMQYLEGETLADRLTRSALPLDQALQVAVQIADALVTAHKAGIVHRDLKPGNIMLTKGGAKLLDFGLAKTTLVVAGGGQSMLPTTPAATAQGTILGTFQYMAPEQLEGHEADARTDVFAFGAVVYEMLTGKKAFEGKSQASLIGAIMHAEPPAISALQPLTPPALDRVVRKCLAKEFGERWQSAKDLHDELAWIAVSGSVVVAPGGARIGNPWHERAAWIMVVAGVLIALVFVRSSGSGKPLNAWLGTRVQLSVNPPDRAMFVGASNVTVPVPVFALSPDGRSLVFAAAVAGAKSSLWLRPLDEGTARQLAGTEEAQYPFWSPDSGWIAFFAEGRLKKLPAAGGPVQIVLDGVPDPRGGSWGRDGTILVGGGATPILRVASSAGGVGTPVSKLDATKKENSHRWPVWLPDGRHFLFSARGNSVDNSGVYVGSIDGSPRRLSNRSDGSVAYAGGYVLYLASDTLIGQRLEPGRFDLSGQPITIAERVGNSSNGFGPFSLSETGLLAYAGTLSRIGRLTWFDRIGTQVGTIGSEADYTDIRLSPDDQRLAFALVDSRTGNPDIWLTDLARGSMSRFTFGPRLNSGPIWSPDGSRIVFRTTRNGGQLEFYQKSSASGGGEVPVLLAEVQQAADAQNLNVVASDWSPDARHLLYSISTTSKTDLWLLPMIGDRTPVRFLATLSDNMHGAFSPDGRLVAYSSNESGRFEVYVQTFPLSDRKWPVSTTGGYEPRWRADGREIYYLSADRNLMAVSVGSGPSFGVPKALFQTRVIEEQVTAYRTHYSPNRDGTRFLLKVQSTDTPPTPITIIMNWAPKP